MSNPVSRSPITTQDWRERARLLQEQINGLSIDELMQGVGADGAKLGESSGRGGDHYNPNQPRVPAGHSGGGQWTAAGARSNNAGVLRANLQHTLSEERVNQGNLQNIDVTVSSALPPGVRAEPAVPEILLRSFNPKATISSRRGSFGIAGALTGTFREIPNGFELTNGMLGVVDNNLATGRIEGIVFSVPAGVTARVILLPNLDVSIVFLPEA
jgi:hypothetical protein